MQAIARTPATAVWIALIVATLLSWVLGTEKLGDGTTFAGALLLLVAFVKVRFIGLYFMELRDAPALLRGLFETYSLVVCLLLLIVYLGA